MMIKLPWLSRDPDVLSGTVIFAGTRVPVAVLFENLACDLTLDQIIDDYPTIDRESAAALLEALPALLEAALDEREAASALSHTTSDYGHQPDSYPDEPGLRRGDFERWAVGYWPYLTDALPDFTRHAGGYADPALQRYFDGWRMHLNWQREGW